MPDRTSQFIPWIAAAVLVLIATGGYVLWITRPRARYEARSLSAAPPASPAKQTTRTLHVAGCDKDFIANIGELVEPRVIPGASLDQFRAIYGKETKRLKPGIWIWNQDPYTLTGEYLGPGNPGNAVELHVKQGHVVETLDGVELGIDSFGALFRKMRDKKVEVQEHIDHGNGNWTLIVSLDSSCGRKFRSQYSRTLPASPELDNLIAPRSATPVRPGQAAGNSNPASGPLSSDVFMSKVVSEYSLVLSNSPGSSAQSSEATHF